MCGGDIQAAEEAAFGTCDSCGTTATLPKANDEKLVNLFNRANHFRRLNEFDKALAAYESILSEDTTNAEAHWCVVLTSSSMLIPKYEAIGFKLLKAGVVLPFAHWLIVCCFTPITFASLVIVIECFSSKYLSVFAKVLL